MVSNTAVALVANSFNSVGTGTLPTGFTTAQYVIYSTATSSTTAGFFWLDLTGAAPHSTQIGNFTLAIPSAGTVNSIICQGWPLQPNRTQPQGLNAVVEVLASGSSCTASGAMFNYYLIVPSAGTVTQIHGLTQVAWADALYDPTSAALTDIVFFDSGTQQVGVYPYTAGANPFLTSATYISGVYSAAKSLRNLQIGGTLLITATPITGGGVQSIYKFSSGSTSAQVVYTEPGPGTIDTGTALNNPKVAEEDGTNVYFVDTVTSGSQYLVQINPNDTAKVLYTNATPGSTPMSVLGADGTKVLVSLHAAGGNQTSTTWNLYSLPTGSTTQTLPTVSYFFTGPINSSSPPTATSELAIAGNGTSTLVFLNVIVANGGATVKSSAIVNPSATLPASFNANFNTWLLPSSVGDTGTVLQVRGITDAQANFIGGGTINKIVLSGSFVTTGGSYNSTPLTAPGGGSVTLASGQGVIDVGIDTRLGAGVEAGWVESPTNPAAVICTLSSNQIVVLMPATNTALIPF